MGSNHFQITHLIQIILCIEWSTPIKKSLLKVGSDNFLESPCKLHHLVWLWIYWVYVCVLLFIFLLFFKFCFQVSNSFTIWMKVCVRKARIRQDKLCCAVTRCLKLMEINTTNSPFTIRLVNSCYIFVAFIFIEIEDTTYSTYSLICQILTKGCAVCWLYWLIH